MVPEWLKERRTVGELETAHLVVNDHLGPDPVPFGFQHDAWAGLLAGMEPGDELWTFRSPPETWAQLCGRAGIAVVRGGAILAHMVTMMN